MGMDAVCLVCGSPVVANDETCRTCGAALDRAPAVPAVAAPPNPGPPPPPVLAPSPIEPPPPPASLLAPPLASAPSATQSVQATGPWPTAGQPWQVDAASAAQADGPTSSGRSRRSQGVVAGAIVAVVLVVTLVVAALNQGFGGRPSTAAASPSALAHASATPSPSPSPSPVASATLAPIATASPSPQGPRTVKIGISLPLSGGWTDQTGPIRDAVLLAIKEAQPIPGVTLEPDVLDHAPSGKLTETQATADIRAMVADDAVMAVVGPYNSGIAYDQIPISNAAKLLQCSPTATWPGLTKGSTALELRSANPSITSFIRLATPTDNQGVAMAEFAALTLNRHHVVIVDGGGNIEISQVIDRFVEHWATLKEPKIVAKLALGKGLQPGLTAAARSPADAVFFAGDEAGAATVRATMAKVGLGKLPLLVNNDVAFGYGDKSYISLAGKRAANTYVATSFQYNLLDYDAFVSRFTRAYGKEPNSWSGAAYSCAQVVIEAIRQAASSGSLTRETVRRAATNPAMTFQTVNGPLMFNTAGDVLPGPVAIYLADATLGGWQFVKELSVEAP